MAFGGTSYRGRTAADPFLPYSNRKGKGVQPAVKPAAAGETRIEIKTPEPGGSGVTSRRPVGRTIKADYAIQAGYSPFAGRSTA